MGLLGDIWRRIKGPPAIDQVFVRLPDSSPEDGKPLQPDDCYVQLYVNSLRLRKNRKFASRFHGVVYSFVTLHREASNDAQMAAISKPDRIANLDENSLERVITVNKQMMGSVAWRGGVMKLELGLFSVKSGNLLSPVLDFVTEVSTAAGVSFVGKAQPFLPLITKGLDMIAGQTDDVDLQVAVDTDLNPEATGTWAIVDVGKNGFDTASLALDHDGKLLHNGRPLQEGYCVFSIRRTDEKPDYGEIPELKEKYAALTAAIRTRKQQETQDALAAFRSEVYASSDLIPRDADAIVEKATQRVRSAFAGGPVSAIDGVEIDDDLASLDIYSQR